MTEYDLLVLGGGSGGVAAARRAASYGARVALIEENKIGGTCVHRGCIPKKLFVYASHFAHDLEDARAYGWTIGERRFDWATLIANKDRELDRLEGVYRRLLDDAGVVRIAGRGRLLDAHSVAVGDARHRARTILIATGGRPSHPPIDGINLAISSDEVFHLPALPGRIAVLGGGYIACEFACIFDGLGVQTTLIHRGEAVLRGFDDELRSQLGEQLNKRGMTLRLGRTVRRIARQKNGLTVTLDDGEVLSVDLVLSAYGRAPNTAGMGLAEIGVRLDGKGAVIVDQWSRSNLPNLYAIGDCTDRLNLTPVAIHEGRALAETLYNHNPRKPDHRDVPTAVFSQPEIGAVGLTEAEARRTLGGVRIYKTRFRSLKHTLTGREEAVFMKLVVEQASDKVVGCHMMGEGAAELVQLLAIAVKAGLTKAQFDATVAVHPTAAEEFVTMFRPAPEPAREAAE
jgi:glutathione reductase (NADPH)